MTYSTKLYLSVLFTVFTTALFAQTTDTLVTIWGGKGSKDGEFNGGLNGWTTKGISSADATKKAQAVWTWSKDGTGAGGAFWGTAAAIKSLTPSNGAAIFNSDQLDNGGVQANVGKGIASPQSGELISPAIDLSKEKDIVVEFYQAYRIFSGTAFNNSQRNLSASFISYSKNGGMTWLDTIVINDEVLGNQASATPFQRIALKGVGGVKDFRVKFVWSGEYYYWLVDDVRIARRENNNMRVNDNFFAVAPNYGTPKSQVEAWGFMSDISNVGSAVQTKVKLKGEVFEIIDLAKPIDATNIKRVFADSLDYGTIKADSTAENVPLKGEFTPPNLAKSYIGSYSISSEQKDYYTPNNTVLFSFYVTDSIFIKDGPGLLLPVSPGADKSYAFGNYFYMPKGKGKFAAKAEFDIRNTTTLKGVPVTLWLYEWKDANNDDIVQESERIIVGYNEYVVKGTEAGLTTIPLLNFDDDKKPIQLKDATAYLLMFEYIESNKLSFPITCTAGGYDYSAMEYRYQVTNKPHRFAQFLRVGKSGDIRPGTFRYAGAATPRVRLHISDYNPLLKTGIKDELPIEFATVLLPNPASDIIKLQITTPNVLRYAHIYIVDASGKTLRMEEFENFSSQQIELNVSNYPNGVYYLQVSTSIGRRVLPFTVLK